MLRFSLDFHIQVRIMALLFQSQEEMNVSILIGQYEFDGPFDNVNDLSDLPGLYAILHYEDEEYSLIQIGQSESIRDCIELSPPSYSMCKGSTLVVALYISTGGSKQRRTMIDEILIEFDCDEEQAIESKMESVRSAS